MHQKRLRFMCEKSSSRGPESKRPRKLVRPVPKLYMATNASRFSSGALARTRLQIAGPIAPHASASETALSQMKLRLPASPTRTQHAGKSVPVRVVPIVKTPLLLNYKAPATFELSQQPKENQEVGLAA